MDMKSMKMSAEQAKEYSTGCCAPADIADAPRFPYGLHIDLCDEAMKSLGMTAMPETGQTLIITARVLVDSCREEARQDGVERNVGMQITDMAIGPDTAKPSAEESLYGKQDAM